MTRTERTYYVVFGLYNFSWSFIGPMYALFLLARGLDVLQVNLVSATYLISAFLFEVPTGAVADLVGRKASFLLSCAVRAVAFGLYVRADGFVDFLNAEVVDALGSTLASGAQGPAFMAWVWVGLNLAVLAGSSLVPRLIVRLRREWLLGAAALLRGTMLVSVGLATSVTPAVGALLVQEVGFGLTKPVVQAWMDERSRGQRAAGDGAVGAVDELDVRRGDRARRRRIAGAIGGSAPGVVGHGRGAAAGGPRVSTPRPVGSARSGAAARGSCSDQPAHRGLTASGRSDTNEIERCRGHADLLAHCVRIFRVLYRPQGPEGLRAAVTVRHDTGQTREPWERASRALAF